MAATPSEAYEIMSIAFQDFESADLYTIYIQLTLANKLLASIFILLAIFMAFMVFKMAYSLF